MLAMKGHHDPIIDQLMKQTSAIQAQFGNLTNKKVNMTKNTNKENVAPSDNISRKTGQTWKQYCWSCGYCLHWGKYCTDKKKRHKSKVT